MAISTPVNWATDPTKLGQNQQTQQANMSPAQVQLNKQIQQLPAYRAYMQALITPAQGPQSVQGRAAVQQLQDQIKRAGIAIPESMTLDPYTGQVRTMTWDEANSGLSALKWIGLTTGIGLGVGTLASNLGSTPQTPTNPDVGSQTNLPADPQDLPSNNGGVPNTGDLPTGAPSGNLTDETSTLQRISDVLKKGGTLKEVGDILAGVGSGLGSYSQAAGQTQLENALLSISANNSNNTGNKNYEDALQGRSALDISGNNSNINGQQAYESEQMARAKEEDSQRTQALKDVYRRSIAMNPNVSPYDPTGGPKYSQQYLDTLGNVAGQGATKLASGPRYNTDNMAPVAPYTPIHPTAGMPGVTPYTPLDVSKMTQPSTLQTVSNFAAPGLSTLAQILKLYS